MLLAVIAINTASIITQAVWGWAVPGDFELTEMGVAVAAFAYLPYCQIAGLNVTADIFTAKASKFWLSLFALLAAVVALTFAIILAWRMFNGMLDQREYDYTSHILSIPIWWGYAPSVVSLALLAFASLASLLTALGDLSKA